MAAFLVGANHEWSREALWAEFPASLGATVFARFWDNLDGAGDLDADIHLWTEGSALADHVGGAGTSTVVLIRGDLIRRYPSVAVMLLSPLDGEPPVATTGRSRPSTSPCRRSARCSTPTPSSSASPRTRTRCSARAGTYAWRSRSRSRARASTSRRTTPASATPRRRAGRTSRGRTSPARADYDALTHIRFADAPWLDDHELEARTWGRNSAHMAGITFQQPFRFIIPAGQLIGGAP